MPGYKGHLFGGCIAYSVVMYAAHAAACVNPSVLTALEWFGFTLAGSLFPDIDTKSKGQKYLYGVLLALFVFLLGTDRVELAAALGILALVPIVVRHRGLFHRPWFVIMFPLAVALIITRHCAVPNAVLFIDAFFFIVGALSHLILDLGFRRTLGWQ